MSTRGVIAKRLPDGTLLGRYHHSDSYPTGLGTELLKIHSGYFEGETEAMATALIDDHPAGWSTILDANWDLEPGFGLTEAELEKPIYMYSREERAPFTHPECYCHGKRSVEESWDVTEPEQDWTYVITEAGLEVFHWSSPVATIRWGDYIAMTDLESKIYSS